MCARDSNYCLKTLLSLERLSKLQGYNEKKKKVCTEKFNFRKKTMLIGRKKTRFVIRINQVKRESSERVRNVRERAIN